MENNSSTKNSALLQQDGLEQTIDFATNPANDNNINITNNQENKNPCKVLNLKNFMQLDLPKPEMLLDPIIQAKSLTMLHAYRGVGKSFFAMSMAYAIATGSKFLRWKAYKPSNVLYIDGEMQANLLQERFSKIAKNFDTEVNVMENLHIFSADLQPFTSIDIGYGLMQKNINDFIFKENIKFVIFDNLSSLTKIDELDGNAWILIQDWLLDLRKRGIAVLLVHHSGKRGGQRGISKREDILDTVINLEVATANKKKLTKAEEAEENYSDITDEYAIYGGRCRLKFEKNRNLSSKDISNFNIDLVDIPDGGIAWVDTYSIVKTLHEQGASYREIANTTGISKSTIGNILNAEK